ncbi:MAG TPA: hypothetical protein VMK05_04040 [Burkholderiales bacterium]|nr:hypothetical protein [Burkholderiales bacterium]
MVRHNAKLCALAAALALLVFPLACDADPADSERHAIPGEKLDSGLGELPHYREWGQQPATRNLTRTRVAASHVPGEKLDSGLGELPPYRDWANDPATRHLTGVGGRVPGEKIDLGLDDAQQNRVWAYDSGLRRVSGATRGR